MVIERAREGVTWRVVLLAGFAATVAAAAERGAFSHGSRRSDPLPGMTIGDDRRDAMPVVTSLRSGGTAERAGIHVGDHIRDVGDRRVTTIADVRDAVRRGSAPMVALHLVRRDGLWRGTIGRTISTDFAGQRDTP